MTPSEFETLARSVLSEHFGVQLLKRHVSGHPKQFDMVSGDKRIVGDAKYYSLVGGRKPPPAKWSTISEHVWFLEKISADTKFLVFGNDRSVPTGWLKKWEYLVEGQILFFFLSTEGNLEELTGSGKGRSDE